MALNMEIVRERLREAFGEDSQATVAGKLNMTQGTISKILSGNQQPTLETIYHISEEYKVSVDWLIGFSEKKRITKYSGETTYASAVEALTDLDHHGAIAVKNEEKRECHIIVEDALLKMLLKKSLSVSKTDSELFQNWLDTKLSLFENRPLLYSGVWSDDSVAFLAMEATTEANWVEVYERAVESEKEYADFMGEDISPFKG